MVSVLLVGVFLGMLVLPVSVGAVPKADRKLQTVVERQAANNPAENNAPAERSPVPVTFDFKWEDPRPQGNGLLASDFLPSGEGWFVGYFGTIVYFDGNEIMLQHQESGYHRLKSVEAIASDDVWVAGDDGTILHYDGNIWKNVESGTDENLYSISAFATDDIWASGQNGVILHYDGVRWSQINAPVDQIVWSIVAVDTFSAWISTNDYFWKYLGNGEWEPHYTVLGSAKFYVNSKDDIWAAGLNYTTLYATHFNGTEWEEAVVLNSSGGTYVVDIDGTPAGDIHISYMYTVWSYDGYGWVEIEMPTTDSFMLYSIVTMGSNEFYVGGNGGGMLGYKDYAWTRYDSRVNQEGVQYGIFALDKDHIWTVGQMKEIMTYDGASDSWSSELIPDMWTMHDVHASSPTNVWAVSPFTNLVAVNQGEGWGTMEVGDSSIHGFSGVVALADDDVWLVGIGGYYEYGIIYHYDGIGFQEIEGDFPVFKDLAVSPTGKLYAGAEDGRVFWHDGEVWSEFVKPPINGSLSKIAVRDDNDIWVSVSYSSQDDRIFHYTNGAWEDTGASIYGNVKGLAVSDSRVFASSSLAAPETLYIYDNGAWQTVPRRFGSIYGISVLSETEIIFSYPMMRGVEVKIPDIEVGPGEISKSMDYIYKPTLRTVRKPVRSVAGVSGVSKKPVLAGAMVTIANEGNSDLTYEVAENADWMRISTDSGIVAPGEEEKFRVILDASGLGIGTHQSTIIITSNDPDESVVEIPVTLEVEVGLQKKLMPR